MSSNSFLDSSIHLPEKGQKDIRATRHWDINNYTVLFQSNSLWPFSIKARRRYRQKGDKALLKRGRNHQLLETKDSSFGSKVKKTPLSLSLQFDFPHFSLWIFTNFFGIHMPTAVQMPCKNKCTVIKMVSRFSTWENHVAVHGNLGCQIFFLVLIFLTCFNPSVNLTELGIDSEVKRLLVYNQNKIC